MKPYAGQRKVSNDIDKAVKKSESVSDKYKAKKEADRKLNFYLKYHNKSL